MFSLRSSKTAPFMSGSLGKHLVPPSFAFSSLPLPSLAIIIIIVVVVVIMSVDIVLHKSGELRALLLLMCSRVPTKSSSMLIGDVIVVDRFDRSRRRRRWRPLRLPPMFNGKENEEDETNVHQQTDKWRNETNGGAGRQGGSKMAN